MSKKVKETSYGESKTADHKQHRIIINKDGSSNLDTRLVQKMINDMLSLFPREAKGMEEGRWRDMARERPQPVKPARARFTVNLIFAASENTFVLPTI